jgi:hypothetical protein
MTKFDTRFVRSAVHAADDARHLCFRIRIGDGLGRRKNEALQRCYKKGDSVSVVRTAAATIVGLALTSFSVSCSFYQLPHSQR